MARRISIARAARLDLENIYVESALQFGLNQARAYRKEITRTARFLSEFPLVGKETALGRTFSVKSHRLIYRVEADRITIVRVLHARQLPPDVL